MLTFRFTFLVLLGLLSTGFSLQLQAAIPAEERAALIAFYNATNGDNWSSNYRWKGYNNEPDGFSQIGTEGSWNGVTVSYSPQYGARVTAISFYLNNLTGSLPAELGDLGFLNNLSLFQNELSGPIPAELGSCAGLKRISLSYNKLTGPIPPELGNLKYLNTLHLNNNQLSGPIPPALGNLMYLNSLALEYNPLNSEIPPELGNLTLLGALDLDSTQLYGTIPPELGNLTRLSMLSLNSNGLTGPIPGELGNLTLLHSLYLGSNQLSGPIPPALGNLVYLYRLVLEDNQLSGSIPAEMGNLIHLSELRLARNQLTGPIPSELGDLFGVKVFDLAFNQLSGPIPSWLANLEYLAYLRLNNNQFSGEIPTEFMGHYRLREISLQFNRLSGPLPSALGYVSRLNYLRLGSNRLIGPIPPELTNLHSLAALDLGYNGLYTDDDILRSFLSEKDPDWEQTQTVLPGNISAQTFSPYTILISWDPILYVQDGGGYEVYYSTASGGPWTYIATTNNKFSAYYLVTELVPGTTYYFTIKTRTDSHSNNPNILLSELSAEVSSKTIPVDTTYTVSIGSNHGQGEIGALIQVTPNDVYGNGEGVTRFERTFYAGTSVTFTAPLVHHQNGKIFSHWKINGNNVYYKHSQKIRIYDNYKIKAYYRDPNSN